MREYFWDALIFPFFEKNGIKSFLMFLVLSAICSGIAVLFRGNQIIYWIMAIIVIIYSFGFLTILAHNKIQSKEEIIPKWNNFRGFFKKGFFFKITHLYILNRSFMFLSFKKRRLRLFNLLFYFVSIFFCIANQGIWTIFDNRF